MGYYDHAEAAYKKQCKEKYEEFKENLRKSEDENDEMIWKHIIRQESEAKVAKERIDVYEKFFKTLRFLLPKEYSSHDILY